MKSGYDQFFKNAQNAKKPANEKKSIFQDKKILNKQQKVEGLTAEEYLRQALKMKDAKKQKSVRKFPVFSLLTLMTLVIAGGLGYIFPQELEYYADRIEFGFLSKVVAAEENALKSKAASNSATKDASSANVAEGESKSTAAECQDKKGFTQEELSHFNKLNDRKKELDRREAELSALEEELHKQKSEIEGRISKLEKIREDVSVVLKDRVEVDQQRVSTLVDFYSNMKPKQAAEIFSNLNEDLAVEVLGKMKKKSAAEIMNLLKPDKAKALSEKFTGYKRR